MGHHNRFYRRIVHNRMANDEEEAKLRELIARFSPTAIYTETLTMTNQPTNLPTTTPAPATDITQPATPTTQSGASSPAALPTNTPATTAAAGADTSVVAATNNPVTNADPSIITTSINTATLTPISLPSSAIPSLPVSIPAAASTTLSAPSASSTSQGSSANVGSVVGGIAGALIGLAVLFFGVRWFLNRRNKLEITPFDADDFRRSAVMLNNEGPHSGGNPSGGYPDMMQHRDISATSPAPTFGTLYGRPGPRHPRDLAHINTNMASDHYGAMGAPHSYGAPYNQYSPPETADSAHPMYPNPAYNPNAGPHGQNPFSPVPSHYTSSMPGTPSTLVSGAGAGIAGVVAGAGMLTRPTSSATHLSNPRANGAPNPHLLTGTGITYPGEGGYVDLNRSSVTPFQQAQYVEISERLGTPVPNGVQTHDIAALAAKNRQDLPPPPQERDAHSPFADPTGSLRSMMPSNNVNNIPTTLTSGPNGARGSAISEMTATSEGYRPSIDDFPAPPSPALPSPIPMSSGAPTKSCVDSTPPTLPEIFIGSSSASGISTPQRVVSYDFPMSVRGSDLGHSDINYDATGGNSALSTPVNAGYPSSILGAYSQSGYPSGMSAAGQAAPGMGQEMLLHPSLSAFKFPVTPSPLASSLGVITPEAGETGRGFAAAQDRAPVPPTPGASQLSHVIKPEVEEEETPAQKKAQGAAAAAGEKRPDTVYDNGDAYGGI